MTAVFILLSLAFFAIYAICNYRLYKELEQNNVPTSLTTAGPGPDVLLRYIVFKRKQGKGAGLVCYFGIAAFVSACTLLIIAIATAM